MPVTHLTKEVDSRPQAHVAPVKVGASMATADPKPKSVATDHRGALDRALTAPTTGTRLGVRKGPPVAGVGDRGGSLMLFSRTCHAALAEQEPARWRRAEE
jgi:hypothetical protein